LSFKILVLYIFVIYIHWRLCYGMVDYYGDDITLV
jgi:hypothetical protein